MRDLADGVLCGHGQLVRTFAASPVIGDEDGVWTNRRHDLRFERDGSAPCFGRRPITVRDPELRRQSRMHLDPRLRVLFHQRSDPPGLRPGQKLTDDPTGSQVDRVLLVRIVNRWAIVGDVEARTSVGKIERSAAPGDRVVAAVLEKPRRASVVIDRGAGARVLAVAWPEDAKLLRDLLVGHARVVRHAAFTGDAQFLEDLAGMREGETARPSQRVRDVLDDAPVLARLPRAVDRLVDLDDTSLDLCHRPFVFLLEATGKHDVRVPGGIVQEEVDGGEELQLVEAAGDERTVRERHFRVEADRQQPFDLPAIDFSEQLVGVDTRTRQILLINAPHARDVPAVLRVADVTPAWELIAFLAVLATALPVGLSHDGAVATLRFADPSRCKHEVDRAERVLHAVRVVLDPACVEEEARLRGSPPLGGLHQGTLRHAGHLGGPRQRPLPAILRDLLEADRMRVDERVIEPVVLNHDLQHACKEGRVTSRLHRQVQIASPSGGRDPRILNNDPGALLARLPDVVRRDGRTLGHVGASDPDHLGAYHVGPRVRRAIDAERLLVRRAGADHTKPAVVVDERRLETHARELAEQIGLLGRQAGAAENADGPGTVGLLNAADLAGHAADRVRVRQRAES